MSSWASRLLVLTVCLIRIQHKMSAKSYTNSGGQKPTVLGTWIPKSSIANRVPSRAHAHALVWVPDSTGTFFILCHLGNVQRFAKSGQVMFQCIRALQDSSQFFGRGPTNDMSLLNMFCRDSLSWPRWLFHQEGWEVGLGLLNMGWMSCHKTSHKYTVLPQWWVCGQVPGNNSKERARTAL